MPPLKAHRYQNPDRHLEHPPPMRRERRSGVRPADSQLVAEPAAEQQHVVADADEDRERQEALLIQIGKEQKMRLRMFDAEGNLWADSFELAEPSFAFDTPGDETWQENLARWLDRAVDTIAGAPSVPDYVEPEETIADAWPELRRAREENLTRIQLRDASDGTPVINTAAPVGLRGATLLTTRNAVDITQEVREARTTLISAVLLALVMSTMLSLYMARTIVTPLRMLASATNRVRQGREREVDVPRLPGRRDEIGQLARAIADMTDTLRQRIDAVEHFAADVAHEIKNPLASLRSALESLGTVEDKDLRQQLNAIAAHDVRRIDRLVSEISEASRIDAELSRATFEPIDLAALASNIVGRRETRDENDGRPVAMSLPNGGVHVSGVPVRLERVIDNLLDNNSMLLPGAGVLVVLLAGLGLYRLGSTDFAAIGGNRAIECHILRFKRHHANALALKPAA
mgnify:CR=1 FL=1